MEMYMIPKSKTIDNFTYYKSTRPSKKLMVKVGNKWIHFGQRNAQHYEDKTGIWSKLNHYDKKRRDSYMKRAQGIKDKAGQTTWSNPTSANYHSYHTLWM